MNERIKQLAKQAGLDDDICPLDEWDNPELEKFAQLIVGAGKNDSRNGRRTQRATGRLLHGKRTTSMNKQLIRDLAEQAGIQMFEDRAFGWSVIAGTDHNVQQFAELIVAECVRVCVDDLADPRDSAELRCAKKIQKHFEVQK